MGVFSGKASKHGCAEPERDHHDSFCQDFRFTVGCAHEGGGSVVAENLGGEAQGRARQRFSAAGRRGRRDALGYRCA
jgi:hypothetical protein